MPEARGVDYEVLAIPRLEPFPEATAIAPFSTEGHFLVYFDREGFKHLDLLEQQWHHEWNFNGSISPEYGLFPYSNFISFVERPPKSLVTYTNSGAFAGRTEINQGTICAVCSAGEALVALLVSTGHIRFVDQSTGQPAGKFLKLPNIPRAERTSIFCLSQIKQRQVVCMKQVRPGADIHYWLCELDELNTVHTAGRNTLKMGAILQSLGEFNELESISAGSTAGEIMLCWKKPPHTNGFLNGKSHTMHPPAKKFCAANLLGEPRARRLTSFADVAIQNWHSIGTYFAEFWTESMESRGTNSMRFRLRDAKFGMFICAGNAALANAPRGKLLVAASQRFSVIYTNKHLVGIRWTLPGYSLQRSIGGGNSHRRTENEGTPGTTGTPERKRKHQDTETDTVNAAFIASLVQLCRGPRTKDMSLVKQNLKPEHLPFTLRTLVSWLSFRRDLSAKVIRASAPGMPTSQQMIYFLSVLCDVFLQSIVQLPTDDVQKAWMGI